MSKQPTLVNAAEDQMFWTQDGQVIRNVAELSTALKEMDEGVFKHHVNKEKDDIGNWIKHVLRDRQLARNLRWTKTLSTYTKKVDARLTEYQQ